MHSVMGGVASGSHAMHKSPETTLDAGEAVCSQPYTVTSQSLGLRICFDELRTSMNATAELTAACFQWLFSY